MREYLKIMWCNIGTNPKTSKSFPHRIVIIISISLPAFLSTFLASEATSIFFFASTLVHIPFCARKFPRLLIIHYQFKHSPLAALFRRYFCCQSFLSQVLLSEWKLKMQSKNEKRIARRGRIRKRALLWLGKWKWKLDQRNASSDGDGVKRKHLRCLNENYLCCLLQCTHHHRCFTERGKGIKRRSDNTIKK